MTLHLRLFNVDDGYSILTATIDTNTRKVTSIEIAPPDLATTFITLNALLGTLEAHLQLQHPTPPA
jgi:hypothetical protein